jgi:hypothetical protein
MLINFRYLLIVILLISSSCRHNHERPFGYLRIGTVTELSNPFNYFPDLRLLLRYDQKGFSVMSTICTHDLTPLRKVRTEQGVIFRSDYTTSTYSEYGKVLQGPAKEDLPYYRLVIASGNYEKLGITDTLFVYIGDIRPATWRLMPKNKPQKVKPKINGAEFLSGF